MTFEVQVAIVTAMSNSTQAGSTKVSIKDKCDDIHQAITIPQHEQVVLRLAET